MSIRIYHFGIQVNRFHKKSFLYINITIFKTSPKKNLRLFRPHQDELDEYRTETKMVLFEGDRKVERETTVFNETGAYQIPKKSNDKI